MRPPSPEGERYTFSQRPNSCVDDVSSNATPEVWKLEQIPKEILRDMQRPAHFQRMDQGNQGNQPQKVFKDLSAKMMSQVKTFSLV